MESEVGPGSGEPVESGADGAAFTPVDQTPGFPDAPAGQPYPGSAWPAAPYGYPPYGYGGPGQPPRGTNGMAVASLVLGICGFFFITPIVGLILGLVSLSAVRKSGQRGKGLAVSGIVLSGAWIALFATFITIAVVSAPDPAHRDASGTVVRKGEVSLFDLRPKDCFTVPAGVIGSTDSTVRNVTVAPCSTPHDSEAVGSFTAAESSFPGMDALRAESVSQCVKLLGSYLQDMGSLPAGSQVQFVYPNAQAWRESEHKVTCFLQFPAATVTRLVYRDASSFTADQLRFLNAVHPVADAVNELNVTSQSASLDVLQQRARDIATADQGEVTALTAAPWPASVQPAVDALVAKHRDAARLWNQAADATDATSFGDAARQANGSFDMTDMVAVRTALGLTTVSLGSAS